MLRSLFILLLGAFLGAAAFHAYYLGLATQRKCGWDHPLDDHAALACRQDAADGDADEDGKLSDGNLTATTASKAHGYATRARHELDDLVGNVTH